MRRASWSGVAQRRPFWCRWFPNRGSRNGDTWSGGLKTNSSDAPDFHDFRLRDPCDFTGCRAYGLFGKEMERKRNNFRNPHRFLSTNSGFEMFLAASQRDLQCQPAPGNFETLAIALLLDVVHALRQRPLPMLAAVPEAFTECHSWKRQWDGALLTEPMVSSVFCNSL